MKRNALLTVALLLACLPVFAQVNAAPLPLPVPQFFSTLGVPLSGGKVYTFAAGTTTPLVTYTDATGTVPNANPVILNASGYPINASGSVVGIWLGPQKYKVILQNSVGVQQWQIDQVGGNNLITLTNLSLAESTAPSCNIGSDILWGDSAGHRMKMCNNGGSADYVVGWDTTDVLSNKTIISPAITSPTESNPTVSGTETHNGNANFKGTANTAASLNKTLYVDGITYTTIDAALAACPAAPISCTVKVPKGTYTSAGFTLGVSPCQVNYAQNLYFDAGVNLTVTGQVKQLCGGYLYGSGPDGTIINADSSGFPTSTPLVEMGDNVNAIDARIQDIAINCNLVSGCTSIRARGLNENSYIGRNIIENYTLNGILIDGTTVNTANFIIEDNDFTLPSAASGDGLAIVNAGALTILRNTFNSGVLQTGAGISITGTINTIQAPTVLQGNTHCERMTDCLQVGQLANVTAIGVDGEAATVNTIHIKSNFTGHIRAINSFNNAVGACPGACIIKNDVNSHNFAANNPPAPVGVIDEYEYSPGLEWWIDVTGLHMPTIASAVYQTATNCAGVGTAASPSIASCGSASAGHFSCATAATGATCQVNTTAVTANSGIFVFESDTAATGTALGVTCNTSTTVNPTTRLLASWVAATSFTINLGTVTTNPACFSYFIVN